MKRTIDIVGALVFFAVFGPLYLMVALGVLISMGRPVHFWQTRLGERGQRFRFYKFRSMVRNSDDVLDEFLSRNDMARTEWDTFQKLEKDPRITPIGAVHPQAQPGRAAAVLERPQGRHEPGRPASLHGAPAQPLRPAAGRTTAQCAPASPDCGRSAAATGSPTRAGSNSTWNTSATGRLWLDIKILLRTVRAVISGEGSR